MTDDPARAEGPDDDAGPLVGAWRSAARWTHALFWGSVAFSAFALMLLIASFLG